MNRMALGLKIRDLREKKRLTQNQLAEKINMSDNGLSNIEGGKANPHFDTIAAIADALDVAKCFKNMKTKFISFHLMQWRQRI